VAIKVLHPSFDRLPEIRVRFEREAIAGAHIDHPNVGAATDFGCLPDGSHFLVLEYIDGFTLHALIADQVLSAQRVVRIGRQIAAGLHAAHSVGIVHRDVKPANIMVLRDSQDVVKLIDFGLAKIDYALLPATAQRQEAMPRAVTAIGEVFGTPAYMAPESITGMQDVDARADLYALGVAMFEMLAGVRPFDHTDVVHLLHCKLKQPAPALSAFVQPGSVPPPLEAVIMRLLQRDKDERYATGKDLDEALAAIEEECFGAIPYPEPLQFPSTSDTLTAETVSKYADALEQGQPLQPQRSPDEGSVESPESSEAKGPATDQAPTLARRRARPSRLWWAAGAVGLLLAGGLVGTWWGPRRAQPQPAAAPSVVLAPLVSPTLSDITAPAPSESVTAVQSAAVPAASASAGQTTGEVQQTRTAFWRSVAKHEWKRGAVALSDIVRNDPQSLQEPEFARAAGSVASSLVVIDPAAGNRLFALLAEQGGTGGVDVLYDIVLTRGAAAGPGKKALGFLLLRRVRERASADTRLAIELHIGGCTDRRGLFERAAAEGGKRTLAELQSLLTFPCVEAGKHPCCFRTDRGLQDTLATVQARLKQEGKDADTDPSRASSR
jgi:eukaryotic-like serine/threonine-protein kinase